MTRQTTKGQAHRERGPRPAQGALDTARAAFDLLVTGPNPLAVDGRGYPGLPDRDLPLNQLRDLLLRRRCPQSVRDAVWAHLVLLSRTQGAPWTVACVGVALPALTAIAARLTARLAGDPSDIHAAVLAGFLAELARVDVRKPRVMLRLRWAAYRAGHAALRETLDAPIPSGTRFRSTEPARPWGHPDLVLARAVAEAVITAEEAELIGATRLERVPLVALAEQRGISYKALHAQRLRAERRLVAYLTHDLRDSNSTGTGGSAGTGDADLATQAVDAATITTAARRHRDSTGSGSSTRSRKRVKPSAAEKPSASEKPRVPVLKRRTETGVQGCGRKPASRATDRNGPPTKPSSQPTESPEVPKCA